MTHTDSLSWQYLDTEQAARAALPGLIQASQASDADSDPGQQAQRLACLLTAYGTLQQLDRVACVAQDLRHCISRGHGLIWRGVLMYHEALLDEPSDPAMALQRLEMAVDQALAQGDPVLAVRALHRMGRVYRVVGDLQGALRAREQGLDIARANDLLREVPSLLIGRGICLFALQRDAEAVDSLEAAALMAAGQSRWNVAANAISGVVEHWVEQGEIVRADEALQRGRQYQKEAGEDSIARREMAVSEAVVLHEQGQQEEACALLQSVIHDYLAVDRLEQALLRIDQLLPWLKGLSRWSDVVHWQERKLALIEKKQVRAQRLRQQQEADLLAEYRDRRQAHEAQGRQLAAALDALAHVQRELALRPAQPLPAEWHEVAPMLRQVDAAIAWPAGVAVHWLQPQDLRLKVSPVRFKAVVQRLLDNAARHAFGPGEGGEVWVTWQALPQGGGELAVSDNGRPLPLERLNHVFQPLPSGLGLFLAHLDAQWSLAGRLRMELRPEGGKSFILRLDRQVVDATPAGA